MRLLTVKVALPALLIVREAVAVVPVITLPNARLPLRLIMRVAGAVPVPDAAIVLVPLVASLLTVTLPLYGISETGANVTVTFDAVPAGIAPLNAPLKPLGYEILLTVKVALPELLIVNEAVAVVPVITLPNARLPLRPTIRVVAGAVPVPDAAIVLVPLAASLFTVTLPLYVINATGAKVTVTFDLLPAAMAPLNAPLKPPGYVMLLTVKVALPALLIVSDAVAVVPVSTLPKVRLPLSAMIGAGAAVPVPEAALVLVPLAASLLTVTLPLYGISETGAKVTVTFDALPAGMAPLNAPLKPLG